MLSMLVYKMGNKAVKNETMVAFFSSDNMSYEVIFNFLLILVFNLSIQLGYFTHVICVSMCFSWNGSHALTHIPHFLSLFNKLFE